MIVYLLFKIMSIYFLLSSVASTVKGFSITLNQKCGRQNAKYVRMNSNDMAFKNIVFLGTPFVAARTLELLSESAQTCNYKIVSVVTQPSAPSGRKQILTKSPVHVLAEKLYIPVYTPEKANEPDFLNKLRLDNIDLCITAAYGNFLPKSFLSIPKYGTVNIHPSLLPKYRGAAPIQRCLESGEPVTGVSLLYTILKMDAGPILSQIKYTLNGNEKADKLMLEMFEIGTKELIRVLPSIFDGTINKIEQENDSATSAAKLTVQESQVDFSTMSALTIHNKCRGYAEWPGIWSYFKINNKIQRIKIITTYVLKSESLQADTLAFNIPSDGERSVEMISYHFQTTESITKIKPTNILRVKCTDGSVLGILELQPENKRVMLAKDFMNGLRGEPVIWVAGEDRKQHLVNPQ